MRTMVALVFCGMCMLITGKINGQETSHFLTPAGFCLPLLEKGEYLLSVNGCYHHQKSITEFDDTLAPDNQYLYTFKYITCSGIYAFSNRFLLQASLQFAPSQDLVRDDYWNRYPVDDIQLITTTQHLTNRISPAITLAYRPKANLEIHGIYNFSSSKEERRYVPKQAYIGSPVNKETYHYVMVGLTYHGKL